MIGLLGFLDLFLFVDFFTDSIYGINPPLFNGRIFKWRPVSRHLNESNPSRIKSDLKGFESLQEDGFKRNHHIPRVFPVTLKKPKKGLKRPPFGGFKR